MGAESKEDVVSAAPDAQGIHDDESGSVRARILQATIEVIDAHGEAGVRVAEVSSRAGVRHPSVYHYFGSRDGLIVAAQVERYRRAYQFGIKEIGDALEAATTREEFIRIIDASIRTYSDEAGIIRRRVRRDVLGSATSRPELAREIDALNDILLRETIEMLSRGHGPEWLENCYDLDAVALWWMGTMQGRQFVDDRDDPRISAQWDDLVARAVIRALFGADAAPDP